MLYGWQGGRGKEEELQVWAGAPRSPRCAETRESARGESQGDQQRGGCPGSGRKRWKDRGACRSKGRVVWTGLSSFPAAVTYGGAGHAGLTGRSDEGAQVSEGAQPDEEAGLVHSNGRRSRRGNRIKLQLFVVKIRGFGFALWQKFRGECLGW